MLSETTLPLRITGPFDEAPAPLTPELEVEVPAVKIEIGSIERGDERVRFRVFLALGFEAEFFHGFKHICHAIVLSVEEPDTRRSAVARVIDPDMNYLYPTWPNMRPDFDWDQEPSIVFSTLTQSFFVEVGARPGPGHAGLWVQASVLPHRSNRVHLDLRTRA